MQGCETTEAGSNPSVLPLYLGLFLTLLAFFILFVGTSRPDQRRSPAAATDAPGREATAIERSDPTTHALSVVAAAFHRLGASMPATPAAGGLDMDLPSRSLFAEETASIRPAAMAAIDRAATALATPRGDNRLALQVTIGLGSGIETAAAVTRTASLAAALLQRGAPPEAFTAGAAPFTHDTVHFRFRLLSDHDDPDAAF